MTLQPDTILELVLAPMEGLMDPRLRGLITAIGGYDRCVSEFVRVSQGVLPKKTFLRYAPEMLTGSRTASGVPVVVQLMGHDPQIMVDNARYAIELGATEIDVNFGCPSKKVNSHQAGASLLVDPMNLYRIVKALRDALPDHIPVTAKMRLGYEDKSLCFDNAHAIEDAGAARLTVHARTKVEGYKPPAHWEYLARIREAVSLPVTANGEIWTVEDYLKCKEISGCTSFMIGRGAVACPDLAQRIKAHETGKDWQAWSWQVVCESFRNYVAIMDADDCDEKYQLGRLKQWVNLARVIYPEAEERFITLRRSDSKAAFLAGLDLTN